MRAADLAACALLVITGCSEPPPHSSPTSRQSSPSQPATASPSAHGTPVDGPLTVRSVVKVEQLVGDFDKHLKKATTGKTLERFGVEGADLGYPFEGAEGRLIFLFGDTIGTPGQNGKDAIGYTTATDPEKGVALDFYARPDGKFLPFEPLGKGGKPQKLLGFEVPIAGSRLPSGTYVAYKTNHAGDEDGSKDDGPEADPTDITYLASFDEKTGAAKELCELSRQPAGRFQKISLHTVELDAAASPDTSVPASDWLLMYGSGRHRASHVYLAVVPVRDFPSCSGVRYFTGLQGSKPAWSAREADAAPVFDDAEAGVGEMSVTWVAPTKRWLALYDNKQGHRKILARDAAKPWGPWTDPVEVFDPEKGGHGVFIHDPRSKPPDAVAGPMIGKNKDDPGSARGGAYAPFVIERWTRSEEAGLAVYFTLSVWNPYVVELMKVTFAAPR